MQESVSSPSSKIMLNKFLQAVQNKAQSYKLNDNKELYNLAVSEDMEDFPNLLKEVINQLKQERIDISQARIITATVCEMLEVYTLNHVYKRGEDESIKKIIKLLGVLMLGATKTPINEDDSLNDTLEKVPIKSSSVTEQTPLKITVNSSRINEENEENYSLIAFKVVNTLFSQINFEPKLIFLLSSFYCVDCREIPSESFARSQKLLRYLHLDFEDYSPEYSGYIMLFEKLGFREIIGLAEFQYRKQNYIQLKSKLNVTSEQDSYSPLEFLKENLLEFYQKLKLQESAVAKMVFRDSRLEDDKLDVDSNRMDYWNYDRRELGIYEKSLLVFTALTNICCDGLFWNCRVKSNSQKSLGFRAKSQQIFTEIHQQWIHNLSNIVQLNIVGKVFTNPQGHQFRKTILDWPLNSFFPEVNLEQTKITQTVIKAKIERLPLSDAVNFLILLYSNIQANANPLGQVQSLYAGLADYLSFNKNNLEWTKEYLSQQGFTAIQIAEILEHKDVKNQ